MSVQSKNPFEVLEEGDDEAPAAPVKESRKEPPTGKKDHATKAAVPEKVPASGAGVPGRGGGKGVDSRGPKRQHDRHSGTGRGRAADGQEDKRGGAGKYNWGSKDAGTTPEDLAQDAKEMTEEEREAAEAAAIEKKKEEEQMSLDEYMKQRKEAQESVEKLSIREVERIDMKGLKPVEKDEDDAFAAGESKGAKGKKNKSGRKTEILTEGLGFKTAPIGDSRDSRDSPGGGRGMRGGGRGGRVGGGRGDGDRSERGRGGGGRGTRGGNAPNLEDASTFPSL